MMLGTADENNRLAAQQYDALLTSSGGEDGIEPVTDAQNRTTGYRNMNTGEVYEKDAFEDLERRAKAFQASPAGGY